MNTRGVFAAAATIGVLLLAAGCGSSSNDEITVQTGSLSKAQFVEKADAICKAARAEFAAQYTRFVEQHRSETSKAQQDAALKELIESVLTPNFENEIKQISELGAPKDYAPEVASFLNALQKKLDEGQKNPAELTATPYPFKKAEDVATAAGMKVCGKSFG